MKKNVLNACAFSIATLLLAAPIGASAASVLFDHQTDNTHNSGHQGSDGTVWATIQGAAYNNKANLNLGDALCGIGFHQSPIAINLSSSVLGTNPVTGMADTNNPAQYVGHQNLVIARYPNTKSAAKGVLDDSSNDYVFLNNGHVVEVSLSKGYPGELLVGHDTFPLVQFHFHAPAEHLLVTGTGPAKQYDAELHFVNQNPDGTLAVLAVFLEQDSNAKPNPALDTILKYTPASTCTASGCSSSALPPATTAAGIPLKLMELIPQPSTKVYTYAGSLTTPACSEGVLWYVLAETLKVPPSQIITLNKYYTGNNRVTQNMNDTITTILTTTDGVASTYHRTVEIHHNFHAEP